VVLVVAALIAILLWAGGERPPWGEWQGEDESGGKAKKEDGDGD
jgi:hypothetical protein